MCHFVNLVLPAHADVDACRQIVKRHGRVLEPNPEPSVARALTGDERAYVTTMTCDCGTDLARPAVAAREHLEHREVARLQREGWSDGKIRRWREQREEVAARKEKSRQGDVEPWLALVTELLDGELDRVGLLVHWVTDDVRRGPTVSWSSLTEQMRSLDANVLYTFTRRR